MCALQKELTSVKFYLIKIGVSFLKFRHTLVLLYAATAIYVSILPEDI